jgi:hypothetical protein
LDRYRFRVSECVRLHDTDGPGFTEIEYEHKTVAQAEADWAAQFNALTANAAGTPIVVWPFHDYGAAGWNTTNNSPTGSPYTTQMFTDFIANAAAQNYEFVTLEDLASRIAAQQKAHIDYTTVGNAITATVTPDPTAPDLGAMALDVINGGTQVIQNVTNWYAYNAQELFLPTNGGTFTINLGATQDNVTHIASLPMRGDLLSVTGDGLNLSFKMVGSGDVIVDLGNSTAAPIVTGATIVGPVVGNQLTLSLTSAGENDVSIILAAPTEVVSTVAFSADTGSSSTDFVTYTAAQTISGTLSAALAVGDIVQVSLDNGTSWLTATAAAGATTFTLAGITLTSSNTLQARVTNSFNASSTPLAQAYVLDQVAPAAPSAPDLAAASDSGVSNTDNITSVTAPTFTGTAEAGSTATLLDGTTVIGTGIATDRTWTITAATLSVGTHGITATAADLAGNTSVASAALDVTISGSVTAPSTPDLLAASDSGASNSDNITYVTKPTFLGTAAAGSTVTLYDGTTAVGTGTATATGNWTVTTTSTLAAGAHSITATAADAAGTVSAASGALSVTIDTLAPAIPSAPDLVAASDSGVSSTDNITNVTRPTFTGTAEAGSTVTLLDGTTVIGTGVATAGTWTITAATLAAGTHGIAARATDPAGNSSGVSNPLTITLDTMPPAVTERLTAIGRMSGTGDPSAALTLTEAGTTLATAAANSSGTWTTKLPALSLGSHNIAASETDTAGNTGTASLGVTVFAVPAPVDGVSTTNLSSSDLARLLQINSYPQFAYGTEALGLADGTLSIGPDTNEAFVTRLYQALLGRAPDLAGLSGWDASLHTSSKSAVAQGVVGSAEYQAAHAGENDTQFVSVLYQKLLGRSADPAGLSGWTKAMGAGMSRGDAAAGIADSPEAKQHWSGVTSQGVFAYDPSAAIVREDYQTAFGREADTSGLTGWTNLLKNGATPAQLAQDLTTTPEFQALHAQQTNAQYVESLYEGGLGRQADQGGAQGWVSALQSGGMTRGDVLTGIAQSLEGQQHLQWAALT